MPKKLSFNKNEDAWIIVRVTPKQRDEFKVACDLEGSDMSNTLRTTALRFTREIKARDPEEFAEAFAKLQNGKSSAPQNAKKQPPAKKGVAKKRSAKKTSATRR